MPQQLNKPVEWRGTSRAVVHEWPKPAKTKVGDELTRVQLYTDPRHWRPMKDIGDGVREITIQATGEAYRVIYVASLGDRVYVLHAFHKKAKKGIATPAKEIDIARNRYRDLCQELASRVTAPRSKQ